MEATPQSEIRDLLVREQRWLQRLAAGLMGSAAAAEDLAQDLQVLALERQPRVRSLRAWLRAAAGRLAMAARRQQVERRRHEQGAARREANGGVDERLQLHRRLLEAVMGLAEPYRSTVVHCYLEGRNARELAQRSGRSPELVRQHLSRALRMLRERLDAEFGDRRSWQLALAPIAGVGGPAAELTLLGIGSAWMMSKKFAWAAIALLVIGGAGYVTFQDSQGALAPLHRRTAQQDPSQAAVESLPERSEPRSAVQTPGTGQGGVRFRVKDEFGRAVQQGRVYLWSGESQHIELRLDERGEARVADVGGTGGYIVRSPGYQYVHATEVRLEGTHEVVLGGGRILQGRVLVNGAPPLPGELDLHLRSPNPTPEGLPESLRELLDLPSHIRPELNTAPVIAGRFAFRGLPADWSGKLVWPSQYLLQSTSLGVPADPSGNSQTLSSIPAELELQLIRLPKAQGRILWEDTRTPVEKAEGVYGLQMSHGCQPGMRGFAIRDGHIVLWAEPQANEIAIYANTGSPPKILGARLSVFVRHLGIKKVFALDADLLAQSPNIELLLPRPATVQKQLLVTDSGGRPVPKAILRGKIKSPPTDAEGRSRLHIRSEGESGMLLYAPGHQIRELEISASQLAAPGPLELKLAAAHGFELHLHPADGQLKPGLWLFLTVPINSRMADFGHAFRESFRYVNDIPDDQSIDTDDEQGTATARYLLDARATIKLHSPPPGETWTLSLRDRLENPVAEHTLRSTPEAGIQIIDVQLPAMRGYRIEVQNEAGEAVPRTGVAVQVRRRGHQFYTDDAGVAEIAPIVDPSPSPSAAIRAPRGYARTGARQLALGTTRIRVQRSLAFDLELIDPSSGKPLPLSFWVHTDTAKRGAYKVAKVGAPTRLDEWGKGPLRIRTRLGGDELSWRFDNDGSRRRLVLPASGLLMVRGRAPDGFARPLTKVRIKPLGEPRPSWKSPRFGVRLKRNGAGYQGLPTRLRAGQYRAHFVHGEQLLDLGTFRIEAGETHELLLPW